MDRFDLVRQFVALFIGKHVIVICKVRKLMPNGTFEVPKKWAFGNLEGITKIFEKTFFFFFTPSPFFTPLGDF